MRFPEIQVVSILSKTNISSGSFKLFYSSYTDPSNKTKIDVQSTSCINVDSAASDIKLALESLTNIDHVEVSQTVISGYTPSFGYEWSITFTGNKVAGDVLKLGWDDTGCATIPQGVNVDVSTLNTDKIVGLDTEIQKFTLYANDLISQGQYTLQFGTEETSCIEWDASASDLMTALAQLNNIDSVYVERFGFPKYNEVFFTYSIYFVGNLLHVRNNPYTHLPTLSANIHNSSCIPIKHFVNGNLTSFADPSSMNLNTSVVRTRGYNLVVSELTGEKLSQDLLLMPTFVKLQSTRRSLSTDRQGYRWTVNFDLSMGDAPNLVCGQDPSVSIYQSCTHTTIVNGNSIQGYFILGSTKMLSSSISASDLETALELSGKYGDISVSRIGPTALNGYTWLVTWLTAVGKQPLLPVSNSLTGSNSKVIVERVQQGNYIGGVYALQLDGQVSSPISVFATSDELKSALQNMSTVGLVKVEQLPQVTTEGGNSYLITFIDREGDVPLLVPESIGLSGVGASINLFEQQKGTVANGTALKLSFDSQLYCSDSNVLEGFCGSPIDYYQISVGSSAQSASKTVKYEPDYNIQIVRIAAPSLYDKEYFNGIYSTGNFKLSYNGTLSGPISSEASENDLRDIIESFPGIETVRVTRTLSKEKMPGRVKAIQGERFVTCAHGYDCDFKDLPTGELIYIGGNWYKVFESYNNQNNTLPLALSTDASIPTSYTGPSDALLYRWGRGYEWAVTFMQTQSNQILPFSSVPHGLYPETSTVSVRLADCKECIIIYGLEAWTNNFLTISAHNKYGIGNAASTIGIPKETPLPPSPVLVESVAGTELQVTFSPPSMSSGNVDISSYVVQWDYNENFVHSVSTSASCSSSRFGSCILSGNVISGTPPFQYLIQNLKTLEMYYVRVSARNSISEIAEELNPTVDSNNWSGIVTASPKNQAPSSPISVNPILSGKSSLQVIFTKPISDGGLNITKYWFEWDSSSGFNSPNYNNISVAESKLQKLNAEEYVYELTGLQTGLSYSVRVSATNSIGTSVYTTSSIPITIAGKPSRPASATVTTALVQNTPISNATASWSFPTGQVADGGSPISGYMIEWWENAHIPEVQLIRFVAADGSLYPNTQFNLIYTPSPTQSGAISGIKYNEDEFNLRAMLINMNDMNYNNISLIGNVYVEKTSIPGSGYEWTVTFNTDINVGNQVEFIGTSVNSNLGKLEVIEITPGSRAGGYSEEQLIEFTSSGTAYNSVSGWFRVSYNNSNTQTQWLPVDVDTHIFEAALGQLNTLRQVEVTKSTFQTSNPQRAGYRYKLKFVGDIGNLPAVIVQSKLSSSTSDAQVDVFDGNNLVSPLKFKLSNAMPGEMPKGYNYVVVDKDKNAFTIPNLVPGTKYFVSVSAVNAFGTGPRMLANPVSIIPPIQFPQPPTDVAVDVNFGSTSNLKVSFGKPISDGGSEVLSYRIELDITSEFLNPIFNTINCKSNNEHSIIQVSVASLNQNDPIYQGFFKLQISGKGFSQTTDEIPFDAVSLMKEEIGITIPVSTADIENINGSYFKSAKDLSKVYFPGNRIKFDQQNDPDQIYTIQSVTGLISGSSYFSVTPLVIFKSPANLAALSASRYFGGRGSSGLKNSRIACKGSYCSDSTTPGTSGSMQAKIQMLTDIVASGVNVDRDEPDISNGIKWRITFLDDSPEDPNNFKISLAFNNVTTLSGNYSSITFKTIHSGKVYPACVGSHIVPGDKALDNGQYYYARVFAENEVGYSLPQSSLNAQKPMVVPGSPTSVVLSVFSSTELRVVFNPPVDDGGDTITAYRIDYSQSASFSNFQSTSFTDLAAGAPFFKKISGLTPGVFYFVRVLAKNSQGFGTPAFSTPSSLNPYQISDGPTNVFLRSTSNSMITVSFDYPLNDGGDTISAFRVEWDTAPNFNSVEGVPNKGTFDVTNPTSQKSFTIQNLTPNRNYYVRVFCINSAGLSGYVLSSPTYVAPVVNVPGKPQNIIAQPGDLSGQIVLSWQPPTIPWHQIPCFGTPENPGPCPSEIGGGIPGSYGGNPITEFEVSYNEVEDFSGYDKNFLALTTTQNTYTISNLTPGRKYFIRVLARNFAGAGPFCSYSDANCLVVYNSLSSLAKI